MTRILQICPHDSMPFGVLCARYAQAAQDIGASVTTVFLGAAEDQYLEFAEYLNITNLTDTGSTNHALQPYAQRSWDLVLCHRYRAYRAAVKTGLARQHCIVLAHEYGMLERWQRRMNRVLFARSCKFAGVAPGIAAELGKVTGKTLVLPNVLDTVNGADQLLPHTAALETLGLTPGPLTVGVIGRLHYKKRPQLALQAFETFAEQQPGARLVLLGDGEERGALAARADARVHLLGSIPDAARLFKAFDVILHTANAEPFGMVVLEAMFAGVPVVALRGHGPEYVLGELGFYPEDDTAAGFAAALQCSQACDRQKLAGAGLERVQQRFSITTLAHHLEQLLTETWT